MRPVAPAALALLLAAAPAAAAPSAPPAAATPIEAAAQAPLDYQKKAITVYGQPDDPIARMLQGDLMGTGRFQWVDTHPYPNQPVDQFVKEVQARRADKPGAYVFVPSLALGDTTSTSPKVDKSENRDGSWTATAYAHLECPYTLTLAMYDSKSGKRLDTLKYTYVLQRRFEYQYTDKTSVEAIQYKAHELARVMAQQAGRKAEEAFASQAEGARGTLVGGMVGRLKEHPLFRLEVQVSGWSAEKDRIAFNLGKGVQIGLDHGFKLMKGDRQIGYLKVRELDAMFSQAQPLWMSEAMEPTDRVIESSKAMWNHGLRVGYGWLGSSLFTAGYGGEVNVGPRLFNASERYLTFDAGFITNFLTGGVVANLGYAQKFYLRNWALRVGGKAGVLALDAPLPLPGGTVTTGLEYHFNEHVLWGTDVDVTAYWPYVPLSGPRAGQTILTWGPVARTGITVLF